MRKRTLFTTLALVVLLGGIFPGLGLAAADPDAALAYLRTQQNADGGFGSGFSPDSGVGSTADAVLAIVAVGGDPITFDQGGNTPLSFLEANAASTATAGDLAKLILAIVEVGLNPQEFGGVDLVANLEAMTGDEGLIGGEADTFVAHLLAILALKSAERPIPAVAVALITGAQQESGAWAWDGTADTPGDTNTTAFAIQALIAAGEATNSSAVRKAMDYYASIRNEDGGWPYQNPSDFGTDTDSNSTAVTMQALIAAGQDPAGDNWATAEGITPLDALAAFQNESGAFAWQAAVPDDNLLSTVQALPAVAGKPFPFDNVGTIEAAPVPAVTTDEEEGAPSTMPETGAGVMNLTPMLVLAGGALAGTGLALRRRK